MKIKSKRTPRKNPDLTLDKSKSSSFIVKKHFESDIPKYRKLYIYNFKLPSTFGKLINEPHEENLTLFIYIYTLLNFNREEIRQNYSYLIEIVNEFDTILKRITIPENIRYSSNDEATKASIFALKKDTNFFVSPHSLNLLKHEIIQLKDTRTKKLESEDDVRRLLFVNGFSKEDINNLIAQAKKIINLVIKNKKDDALFELELLKEQYGKFAPAVVGLLANP